MDAIMPTGIGEQLHFTQVTYSKAQISSWDTLTDTPGNVLQAIWASLRPGGINTQNTPPQRKHCEVAGSWCHSLGPNLLLFCCSHHCQSHSLFKNKCSLSFSPTLLIPTPNLLGGRGLELVESRVWLSQSYPCDETQSKCYSGSEAQWSFLVHKHINMPWW